MAAEYHWALFGLWKAERDPAYAAEALRLEEEALRDARNGTPKEMTYQILSNAACLRALMIQAGTLDASEGTRLIEMLSTVLSVAGDSTVHIARVMLSDSDLDALRAMPAFQNVASKARAVIEASSDSTGR